MDLSNTFLKQPEIEPTITESIVTETVIPETSEQNVGETKEPVEQEKSQEQKTTDYFKKVEELTGGKYKFSNDDEFKAFFDNHDKIKTEYEPLKSKQEWFDEVEKYIGENKNDLNPILQFESKLGEGSYKKALVASELSKIGDKSIALELVSSDLDQVDDLELITKFSQFESQTARKNPDAAVRSALKRAGIQVSKEDDLKEVIENLDADDKISIEAEAKKIRSTLKTAIDNVQMPEYVDPITKLKNDFEQKQIKTTELQGKWEEAKTSLKNSFDKITFKDVDFEFEIPEQDKEILNDFLRVASKQGIEPNDANKLMILNKAKQAIRDQNFEKIVNALKTKIESDIEKKLEAKYKNLTPLQTDRIPIDDAKTKEAQSSLRRQWDKSLT